MILKGTTDEDDVTVNVYQKKMFLVQKDKLDDSEIEVHIELSVEQAKELIPILHKFVKLPTAEEAIDDLSRQAVFARIPAKADGKWLNRWIKNFKI